MSVTAARRRLCQALDLVDSAEKIAEYQRLHERIWPEVAGHLRPMACWIWRFTGLARGCLW